MQESFMQFPSPIGELHFSISNRAVASAITDLLFPSPIGELHFSITTHNIEDYWNNLFPSPIGELHFSMCYYFSLCYLLLVSVPYRGATFLNASVDVAPPKHSEFPSPIGELHFSIINHAGQSD